MNPCQSSYPSGAASLFSVMAREAENLPEVIAACPRCLSEDTEMVDHDMQIYQCRDCGETFERPPG